MARGRPIPVGGGGRPGSGEAWRTGPRRPGKSAWRPGMPWAPPGLPDALVGLAPYAGRALRLRLHDRPQASRQALAAPRVQQDRVQRGAVDVVLALVVGPVADPHRMRPGIARELLAERLRQIAPAVDPVHDLQRPVLIGLEVANELHELLGLPVEVQEVQCLQRERRVAQPGVAVVPVARAAGRLRQRRRQRSDGRPRRHVRQALDRQCGALDRVAPTVIGDASAPQPIAPEAGRRRQLLICFVDALRPRELLGPRKRAEDLVAAAEDVTPSHALALDPDREIRSQADRDLGAARVRHMTVVGYRPLRRNSPVVEDGLARQLYLDLALQAHRDTDEDVGGIVIGGWSCVWRDAVLVLARSHRERVTNEDPTAGCLPGCRQRVRPRLADPRPRDGYAE